jgi:1-acyl-sn-glycerol-3-phosphate acyltransferase
MSLTHRAVTSTIKGIGSLLCRVDVEELNKVPAQGPLILVCNHINFLDILLYPHLQPRLVTGFAKSETWDNPAIGSLFSLWEAIPLHRNEPDASAIQKGLLALETGKIVVITPEGTRSGHGRLQRGLPGVVVLALHSKAPLMPLVFYGAETYRHNLKHLQRSDFHVKVGRSFHINPQELKVTRLLRQDIADEIMFELADLLPERYRGFYNAPRAVPPLFLRYVQETSLA